MKKDIDNLGAYLSAYLGDIELTAENIRIISECCPGGYECYEVKEADLEGNKKDLLKAVVFTFIQQAWIFIENQGVLRFLKVLGFVILM